MKKEEILQKHIDGCQWYAPACDARVYAAMEEYASQFKVEPGLTLQQCKNIVAQRHGYADWYQIDMTEDEEWERDAFKASVLDEVAQLFEASNTASLTSEIKGLREEVEISFDWLMKCIGVIEQLVSYEPSQAAKDKVNEYVQKIKEKLSPKTDTNS